MASLIELGAESESFANPPSAILAPRPPANTQRMAFLLWRGLEELGGTGVVAEEGGHCQEWAFCFALAAGKGFDVVFRLQVDLGLSAARCEAKLAHRGEWACAYSFEMYKCLCIKLALVNLQPQQHEMVVSLQPEIGPIAWKRH
jgi:hypothetical protein